MRSGEADPLGVIETLLVLGAVAMLGIAGLAGAFVPLETLLYAGGAITLVGLAVGVPTGLWYHVALYRALRPRGPLPQRWWLHPVPLHEKLRREERSGVLRWFVIGGLGFGIVVIGCLVVVFGLMVAFVGVEPG